MEENEEFDSDFNSEDIPISEEFWNYMEHYWHNNREFPESTEASLNKKADLVDGKVPSSQLPSYVDDVLEFDTFQNLPNPGEKGKIYIITNDNSQFRWSGSEYIQLNSDEYFMTTNTYQDINGQKIFYTTGGNLFSNNKLWVSSYDSSFPGITFQRGGYNIAALNYDGGIFHFNNNAVDSQYGLVKAAGFYKNGSDNNHVLLGNGSDRDINDFVTNDSGNNIFGKKWFKTDGGNTWDNNTVRIQGINGYNAGLTFYRDGIDVGQIIYNGYSFQTQTSDGLGYIPIKSSKFIKEGSDQNHVLLGDGTDKPLSDFATSVQLGNYALKTGDIMSGSLVIDTANNHLQFSENNLPKWHIESIGGEFNIVETGVAQRLRIIPGASTPTYNGYGFWHTGNLPDYRNYGLGRTTHLEVADVNNITNTGVYGITPSSANKPLNYATLIHSRYNNREYSQIAVDMTTGRLLTRAVYGGGQYDTGWTEFWNSNNFNPSDYWKINDTTNYLDVNYLKLSGGTLTGGGKVKSNGDIFIQQNSIGGNATGLFWEKIDNSAISGGIGSYTENGEFINTYMGWGVSPWDTSANFTVGENSFTYKNNNIWHAGNLPDYRNYGLGTINATGASDLNNILQTSTFGINDTTLNRPLGLDYGTVWTHRINAGEFTQIAIELFTGTMFTRAKSNGSGYTPWVRTLNSSNFNPDDKISAGDAVTKAIGFTAGDINLAPYIYTNTGEFRYLATQNWVDNQLENYVDRRAITQGIDGLKTFTGTHTQWQLNGDSNNALGFVQSMPDRFALGTLNNKSVVLYHNTNSKVFVQSDEVSFVDNITIPAGTQSYHGVNLGQLNTQLGNYVAKSGDVMTGGLIISTPDSIGSNDLGTLPQNLKLFLSNGNSLPNNGYGTAFWTEGSGQGYIQQQRADGISAAYRLNLQPYGGELYYGNSEVAKKSDLGDYVTKSGDVMTGNLSMSSGSVIYTDTRNSNDWTYTYENGIANRSGWGNALLAKTDFPNAVTYYAGDPASTGFKSYYGTSLHIKSDDLWYNRLDISTNGDRIDLWQGINTHDMSHRGLIPIIPNGVINWTSDNLPDYRNYGLGRTTHLEVADVNDIPNSGIYGITPNSANKPFSYGTLLQSRYFTGEYSQIAVEMTTGKLMTRAVYGGGQYDTGWVEFWNSSNFNPNTKANALELATGVGMSDEDTPYMVHSTAGAIYLATKEYASNVANNRVISENNAKALGFVAGTPNTPYVKHSDGTSINLATEKWSSNNFVTLSSDQNIDGRKRFANPIRLPGATNSDEAVNLGQTLELVENRTNSKFLTRTTNDSNDYDLVEYGRPQITNIICKGNGGYSLDINHFETGMTVKVSNTTDNTIYINFNGGATSAIVEKISWAEFHLDSDGDIIKTDAIQAKII